MAKFRPRWSLAALMGLVALCAIGFYAAEQIRLRNPIYKSIRVLRRGDASGRRQAALDLGRLGTKASIAAPALRAALRDPDAEVRRVAINALVAVLGPRAKEAVPDLIERLEKDPDQNLRRLALSWLVQQDVRSPAVIRAELAVIADPDMIRASFFSTVSRWQQGKTPEEVVARAKPPASMVVPALRPALDCDFDLTRSRVTAFLAAATVWSSPDSPELAEALLAALKDPSSRVQREAVLGLRMLNARTRQKAVAYLVEILRRTYPSGTKSTQPARALEVTMLLTNFGADAAPAVPVLVEGLHSEDETTRMTALYLLGRLGGPQEFAALPGPLVHLRPKRPPTVFERRRLLLPVVPDIIRVMLRPSVARADIWFFQKFKDDAVGGFVDTILEEDRIHVERFGASSSTGLAVLVLDKIGEDAREQALDVLMSRLDDEEMSETDANLVLQAFRAFGPGATRAVPALVELLKRPETPPSEDPSGTGARRRDDIIRTLGLIGAEGDARTVAELAKLLSDPDPRNRSSAASALSYLGRHGQAAAEALFQAVDDPEDHVRYWTIRALGKLGLKADQVVPTLMEQLHDDEWDVRIVAVEALGNFGEAARPALPDMLGLLRALNSRYRYTTARALRSLGPVAEPAIPALLTALDDQDHIVAGTALQALDQIAPAVDKTVPDAISGLQSSDPSRRRQAIVDLARLKPEPKSIEALREALKDEDAAVRASAAAALGHFGVEAESAGDALLAALKDDDPEIRIASAHALVRCVPDREETVPALLGLLDDPERSVRLATISALGELGPKADPAVPELARRYEESDDQLIHFFILNHLGRIGSAGGATEPILIEALQDQSDEMRGEALHALYRIASPSRGVTEAVLLCLNDESLKVRKAALYALGHLASQSPVAKQTLLSYLNDESPDLRRTAAFAIGQVRPAETILLALLELLEHDEPRVRQGVYLALSDLGPKAAKASMDALIAGLDDPDPGVRSSAAYVLFCLGAAAAPAESALRRLLDDEDFSVRRHAADTLEQIKSNQGPG